MDLVRDLLEIVSKAIVCLMCVIFGIPIMIIVTVGIKNCLFKTTQEEKTPGKEA